MTSTGLLARHHVLEQGRSDGPTLLFVHGYGCDQSMWRELVPHFTDDYRVLTYDQAGSGGAEPAAYDPARHSTLSGYADDLLAICAEAGLRDVTVVGHSVSAMIAALAHLQAPEVITRLVLVGPSPRYIDEPPYVGGFSQEDIDELLGSLSSNFLGWANAMAPAIMGVPEQPALGQELTASFCRTDPEIARQFAQVTFLSDTRRELAEVSCPTLVIQCTEDLIAPVAVGEYVRDTIAGSSYALLDNVGHCPHLSVPTETAAAIQSFLEATTDPAHADPGDQPQ